MASRSQKAAALKEVTDSLRARGGPQCGTGKLAVRSPHGEVLEWKDYVRGKDLAKWLRGKQELLDQHTRPQSATRTQEDQIQDLVTRLLEAKLLLPADRKFKKPKPGKKKVVKFPRTLEPSVPEWSEELFYAISYEQPWGATFYILSGLVVVGVIGVTLFPLAPHSVRLAVLYLLSGLLCVLLGTMVLRYVVWFGVWLATGAHFWLLPNMMSEELPITEIFSPAISYAAAAPGDKSSSLALRGAAALVLGICCCGLYSVGPDAATVKGNLQGARDSVLNYFDLVDSLKQGIANGTNTTGIQLNTTTAAGSSSPSGAQQQQQQQAGGTASSEQHGSGSSAGQGAAAGDTEEQQQEWDPVRSDSDNEPEL